MRGMRVRQGFTLIELLIVVAIIAILAAIAVPNFLEAQVRSKVARAKSDMRTLATAVESYRVDNNNVPPGYYQTNFDAPAVMSVGQRWSFWTSPIAYMSSIPEDPFTAKGRVGRVGTNPNVPQSEKRYIFTNTDQHRVDRVVINNPNLKLAKSRGVDWILYSWGPSRRQVARDGYGVDILLGTAHIDNGPGSATYPNIFYDPSNGTVSYGWIIRSNKGIEPSA